MDKERLTEENDRFINLFEESERNFELDLKQIEVETIESTCRLEMDQKWLELEQLERTDAAKERSKEVHVLSSFAEQLKKNRFMMRCTHLMWDLNNNSTNLLDLHSPRMY